MVNRMRPIIGYFNSAYAFFLVIALAFFNGCVVKRTIEVPPMPPCDTASVKIRSHPVIGNYHVYYGGFHNHSMISDGTGSPEYAYGYAKCVAGLDFFGLSDHDDYRNNENWYAVMDAADLCNDDGDFATFWGFEWTSSIFGHVTVVNTDDFTASSDPQTHTFQQLCSWLSTRNCFAILNHPGWVNPYGTEFDDTEFHHFSSPVCGKVVGIELWNKDCPFSCFYYTDGYFSDDNNKGLYDEALGLGWKVGAAGGFDNHTAAWGTAVEFRLAVLAPALTRADIATAMTARRFYSTLDKNIALSFTLAGHEMGSTIPGGTSALEIRASDGNGEIFSEVVLFDSHHDTRRLWNLHETSVAVADTLSAESGDYFYVIIRQEDGDEAVSSPIWVSDASAEDSAGNHLR